MIHATQRAAIALAAMLKEKNAEPGTGLRLGVERGGCAGLSYVMRLSTPTAEDAVIPLENASIVIDAPSLPYLQGCEIDYSDALNDAGFKIHNPNASRSCGCGTSFEPSSAPDTALPDGTACN